MAITITNPKNWLLKPLFLLLVIILAPLALFFSLVRIPFANRRKRKLEEILEQDWQPRKKYIYIGFNGNYPCADFIKSKILPKYGQYIIWDRWDEDKYEWSESEPDTDKRVTTFWQDIGEDFDGDLKLVIAYYTPDNFTISPDNNNFYTFYGSTGADEVNSQIEYSIQSALKLWGIR